ncbi:MAG: Ig-like domain-containing protein [Bacteroidaceae bacterium]|nr:Ig-like domain-containing protein [Bacteroidaceae bacterium]
MLRDKHTSQTLLHTLIVISFVGLIIGCASIGSPDGGPFDETPPVFLGSTPVQHAINVDQQRVTLEFDEYIKIEKASEKVVISPPQIQQPIIKTSGKKIIVSIEDSLRPNTTYTIDFNDAVVDNNEANPLGNFAFTFSTGDHIDTLCVSGLVLDASNLEPVPNILVGLHSNLEDSAFTTLPFDRVSRTDADGHFTIRGIAEGKYRAFALQDMNQNYIFDQKTEMLSWLDSLVIPSTEVRMEPDTTWIDSLTIDTIRILPVTHFLPEDLVLLAFTETPTFRYLQKSERPTLNKFTLLFSTPGDSLPLIEPLNFPADSSYIVQPNPTNDTITYWMLDTTYFYQDTLSMAITYMATDTLGMLSPQTDTLQLVPKKTRSKYLEEEAKKRKEEEKEREKRLKKGDSTEVKKPEPVLPVKYGGGSAMDINAVFTISFDEPLKSWNDTALHLYRKVDSLFVDEPFVFRQVKDKLLQYELLGEWRPEQEYKFVTDSAAFKGIYGLPSKKNETSFKFNALDKYSSFTLRVIGAQNFNAPGSILQAQIVDKSERVVRQTPVVNGTANFYFLRPSTYYVRLLYDLNGNGVWDTGLYEEHLRAEPIYYYGKAIEMRENWDYSEDWNPFDTPVDKQKPSEMKKSKKEKKEKKSKNEQREEQKRKRAAGQSSGGNNNFGF